MALHVYVAGRFILSIVGPSIFTELAVLHYHLRGPPCLRCWPFYIIYSGALQIYGAGRFILSFVGPPYLGSWPFYIIICGTLNVYGAGRFILSFAGPSMFMELVVVFIFHTFFIIVIYVEPPV